MKKITLKTLPSNELHNELLELSQSCDLRTRNEKNNKQINKLKQTWYNLDIMPTQHMGPTPNKSQVVL